MREIKEVITLPADRSPQSIKNVVSVLIFTNKKKSVGIHSETKIIHLEGTVEEKLQIFKDETGTDWDGFDEETITIPEEHKSVSLNIGKESPPMKSKVCIAVQKKIDAITEQARQWLKEDKEAKSNRVTQKEVEALLM